MSLDPLVGEPVQIAIRYEHSKMVTLLKTSDAGRSWNKMSYSIYELLEVADQ